jgi:lipoate synthase
MNALIEFILFLFSLWLTSKMKKTEEIEEEQKKLIKENLEIVFCRTEKVQDMIYVWELKTDTFLVQGRSMEKDIVPFFVKHYPNKKILFTENPDDQEARA